MQILKPKAKTEVDSGQNPPDNHEIAIAVETGPIASPVFPH
jgi:hypothetical protein